VLSFVTGNLDREGGNILSVGFYPAAKAGRVAKADPFFESRYGKLRRIRGSLPGNLLADEILLPDGEGPLRALFVVAGNPLLSVGGEAKLRRALERLELLVVVDLYRNATGELAHWCLPSTDMYERPDLNLTGLGLQAEPFVQYTEPVVAPRAERREEWWIFARLAQALGLKSPLDGAAPGADPAALHAALFGRLDHMLRYAGLSLEALRAAPHGVALPPLAPGRFYREQIQTPDGRVDCCPALFAEALERAEAICRELEAEGPRRLKLVTRRDASMHNSWYHNVAELKRPGRLENRLYLHPEDAAERGLADGQRVRVRNENGEVEVRLAFDDGLLPGVVALTHGWGHARAPGMRTAARHPGANANALLPTGPGSFEPLSNQAFMTGVPVELEALPAEG
jgi:anaerobic selenocysteine-containing dehydrogenase